MIKEETAKIQQLAMKTVKGSMKIHAVVGLGDGKYTTGETSCFKECCYMGGEFFSGVSWVGEEGSVI